MKARLADARTALQSGRVDLALQQLAHITSTEPANAEAFGLLAMANVQARKFSDAQRAIRRALELGPANAEFLLIAANIEQDLGHWLPGVVGPDGPRWDLFCGTNGTTGADAVNTQVVRANVDPSDRYIQCAPGTDQYRLRADESGFDNLYLAGDWTDNGLNAGCIEAATLSGLQAANAILGRARNHRIAGRYLG